MAASILHVSFPTSRMKSEAYKATLYRFSPSSSSSPPLHGADPTQGESERPPRRVLPLHPQPACFSPAHDKRRPACRNISSSSSPTTAPPSFLTSRYVSFCFLALPISSNKRFYTNPIRCSPNPHSINKSLQNRSNASKHSSSSSSDAGSGVGDGRVLVGLLGDGLGVEEGGDGEGKLAGPASEERAVITKTNGAGEEGELGEVSGASMTTGRDEKAERRARSGDTDLTPMESASSMMSE